MNTKEISKNLTQDEMAFERTEMSSERTAMAVERTEMASERTAMAIERTEMAFERTRLTNSQTLLAYCRTAIGFLAAGIGMFEFVNNETITHLGILISAIAPIIVGIGITHFILVRRKLHRISEEIRMTKDPS